MGDIKAIGRVHWQMFLLKSYANLTIKINTFEIIHSIESFSFRKNSLNAALQLCNVKFRETFASNGDSNKTDASIYEYISKISFPRSSIFKSCAWVGETFDCDQFNIFLTEGGPCFTFNMLNIRSIYSDM